MNGNYICTTVLIHYSDGWSKYMYRSMAVFFIEISLGGSAPPKEIYIFYNYNIT